MLTKGTGRKHSVETRAKMSQWQIGRKLPAETRAKISRAMQVPLEQRFWSKVEKTDGCWLWIGEKNIWGYGQIAHRGKHPSAHRVSWELHYGPIPQGNGYHGTCVLHKCDIRACVNPEHLFLGTAASNAADRDSKGRGAWPKGKDSASAKLTEAQILEIRAARGEHVQLARKYGVSATLISGIRSRKRWAHVKTPFEVILCNNISG